jgi:non-homologous end joining protein Ku
MRAIWKGAVSFGLVSVPVKLYSATESHDIAYERVLSILRKPELTATTST